MERAEAGVSIQTQTSSEVQARVGHWGTTNKKMPTDLEYVDKFPALDSVIILEIVKSGGGDHQAIMSTLEEMHQLAIFQQHVAGVVDAAGGK